MIVPKKIAVVWDPTLSFYPEIPPFSPSEHYPEYCFQEISSEENRVYAGVRNLLFQLGLDKERFGQKDWNPFGEFIKEGDTVVIKPNLVKDFLADRHNMDCIITHGSIIRAVTDYVAIALRKKGKIIIGDAPLQCADFERLITIVHLDKIRTFYNMHTDLKVQVRDFRREVMVINKYRVVTKRIINQKEQNDIIVDLGSDSMFNDISSDFARYRVPDYNPQATRQHHNELNNEYIIAGPVIQADAIINLPKLKTHRKAGITASLKNIIGIIASKDCIPHHRRGSKQEGYDEYIYKSFLKDLEASLWEKYDVSSSAPRQYLYVIAIGILRCLSKIFSKDPYLQGGWHGNDTLWRGILDLNRILSYADRSGKMQTKRQKRCLSIIDAIVAGQKEGPVKPTRKPCGLLIAGFNSLLVDTVATLLMGFDFRKIPMIRQGYEIEKFHLTDNSPDEIEIQLNNETIGLQELPEKYNFHFEPSKGWLNHIEQNVD